MERCRRRKTRISLSEPHTVRSNDANVEGMPDVAFLLIFLANLQLWFNLQHNSSVKADIDRNLAGQPIRFAAMPGPPISSLSPFMVGGAVDWCVMMSSLDASLSVLSESGRMAESEKRSPQQPPHAHTDHGFRMVVTDFELAFYSNYMLIIKCMLSDVAVSLMRIVLLAKGKILMLLTHALFVGTLHMSGFRGGVEIVVALHGRFIDMLKKKEDDVKGGELLFCGTTCSCIGTTGLLSESVIYDMMHMKMLCYGV
ncbi:hypothetical protein Tco_0670161 [Tanacetum coccineum]